MVFLRFAVTGLVTTATHTAVVLLLTGNGAAEVGAANFIAFLGATAISFVMNSWWSFQRPLTLRSGLRFGMVAGLCACAAAAIAALAESRGLPPLGGIGAVVIAVTPMSYVLHRNWTYREKPGARSAP